MQYKVVLTDHVYPDLELETQVFNDADAEFVFLGSTDEAVIKEAVRDADAVITAYAVISKDIIEGMTKCRSISKTGIGVNNIDVEAASAKGIKVLNVPDYCIEEVSDHAFALAMSIVRRIPMLNSRLRGGDWSLGEARNIERLNGKTVGLLGYGRIARRFHEKVKPYNVEVLAYDPYLDAETIGASGAKKAEFEEVLAAADIISLHLPLTAENEHMLDAAAFGKMKPNAIVINTSRGPLIDEAALYDAVKEGKILAAGLDVLEKEGYDPANKLYELDMVLITPHAAYNSLQATQELREKVAADVVRVLKGEEPRNQVNR